jgi:HAD superfamily phosphoserine phosphatase-like hydrolase
LLPVFFAFKIGIIPNWRAKELLFSYFFKGMNEEDILKLGTEFSEQIIPGLLRPEAVHEFEFHKKSGNQIIVVTASFPIWIKPWCDLNHFELIATEYEIRQTRLTGLIQGKNCFGLEKVKRIKEEYDLSRFDQIYAYGDSYADL